MSYIPKKSPKPKFAADVYIRQEANKFLSLNDMKAQLNILQEYGSIVSGTITDPNYCYKADGDLTIAVSAMKGDAITIQNVSSVSIDVNESTLSPNESISLVYDTTWVETGKGFYDDFSKQYVNLGNIEKGLSITPSQNYQALEEGGRLKINESLEFEFNSLEINQGNYESMREYIANGNVDVVFYDTSLAQVLYGINGDVFPVAEDGKYIQQVSGTKHAPKIASFYDIFKLDKAIGDIAYGISFYKSGDDFVYRKIGNYSTAIQDEIARVVLNDDRTINYYLDPNDSSLKKTGGSANLDGTDGQVMTYLPRFYYRLEQLPNFAYELYIAPTKFEGSERFGGGYVGAFPGYDNSGKLTSIANKLPTVDKTRDELRTLAEARGEGWSLVSIQAYLAITILQIVEFVDFDLREKIGFGNNQFNLYTSVSDNCTTSGASISDGNGTNNVQTPGGSNTDYMTWRGIENWFGNIWEFLDGINIKNIENDGSYAYMSKDQSSFSDLNNSTYFNKGSVSKFDGFGMFPNINLLIPNSVGAFKNSYMTEQVWNTWDELERTGYGEKLGAVSVNGVLSGSTNGLPIAGRLMARL